MSKKNGTTRAESDAPQFNFRKMGYRDESKMARFSVQMAHLEKRIQACAANDDINSLLDELSELEEKSLTLMIAVVAYLPEDYLIEGVASEDVNYDDPSDVLDNMRFGSLDSLALDIAESRRDYKKK